MSHTDRINGRGSGGGPRPISPLSPDDAILLYRREKAASLKRNGKADPETAAIIASCRALMAPDHSKGRAPKRLRGLKVTRKAQRQQKIREARVKARLLALNKSLTDHAA